MVKGPAQVLMRILRPEPIASVSRDESPLAQEAQTGINPALLGLLLRPEELLADVHPSRLDTFFAQIRGARMQRLVTRYLHGVAGDLTGLNGFETATIAGVGNRHGLPPRLGSLSAEPGTAAVNDTGFRGFLTATLSRSVAGRNDSAAPPASGIRKYMLFLQLRCPGHRVEPVSFILPAP